MTAAIDTYRITRYHLPLARRVGDSQVRFDALPLGALELSGGDHVGLGFFYPADFPRPLPPLAEVERAFAGIAPMLAGHSPFAVTNRVSRPRGADIRADIFAPAIHQAAWDLQGKMLGLPLYRLFGGTHNRVRAYASGLEYHLSPDDARAFFARAAAAGFTAFKIKVGHPDLAWDLGRLAAVRDVVGADAVLMVDANEAWSPKEAIYRAHAYRDAGFTIYWIEDPCLRDDYVGWAEVARATPFTRLNGGEYLDLQGKRLLLEKRAVDVLNIHDHLTESLRAAWLAADYGLPVTVGNTAGDLGVHLAAALPHATWMEYSSLDFGRIVEEPIAFVDGHAVAPDRPGHGLTLLEAARATYGEPGPWRRLG